MNSKVMRVQDNGSRLMRSNVQLYLSCANCSSQWPFILECFKDTLKAS